MVDVNGFPLLLRHHVRLMHQAQVRIVPNDGVPPCPALPVADTMRKLVQIVGILKVAYHHLLRAGRPVTGLQPAGHAQPAVPLRVRLERGNIIVEVVKDGLEIGSKHA